MKKQNSQQISSSSSVEDVKKLKLILSSPLVHAIAGSLGSALSLWLMYPLERVRIEMQTNGQSSNHHDDDSSSQKSSSHHRTNGDDESFEEAKSIISSPPTSTHPSNNSDSFQMLSNDDDNSINDDNSIDDENDGSSYTSNSNASSVEDIDSESEILFEKASDAILFCSTNNGDNFIPNQNNSYSASSLFSSEQSSTFSDQKTNKKRRDNDEHCNKETKSSQPKTARMKKNKKKDKKLSFWKFIIHLHKQKQLYKGAVPMVSSLAISNFIFFYTLHYLKRVLVLHSNNRKTSKELSSRQLLLASSMAGVINVLITNPLYVANLNIIQNKSEIHKNNDKQQNYALYQHQDHDVKKKNNKRDNNSKSSDKLIPTLIRICRQDGFFSLWNGVKPSLLLVSNPAIHYFVYEAGKKFLLSSPKHLNSTSLSRNMKKSNSSSLAPMEAFLLGACAKSIATVITYPLQLAQIELRKSSPLKPTDSNQIVDRKKSESMWNCLNDKCRKNGFSSLYIGMSSKLLQTVLTSAFTFLTYEQILHLVAKAILLSYK